MVISISPSLICEIDVAIGRLKVVLMVTAAFPIQS